jgi:iron complex outermembrane receptor protein
MHRRPEFYATDGFSQLQSLPQVDNMGVTESSRTGTGGAANITYGSSINLRGLSPFATLTLLDGHRVPQSGTTGGTVDPDDFPSIMIQRVDVETDGASAIYGSDAIAGVVNLILRRNVEGVEARVNYGWADAYNDRSIGFLAGHHWSSGQISIGYENDFHSALNGESRSFFESDQTALGGHNYDVPECNPGNIVVGGTTYAIPAGGVTAATAGQLTAGTENLCDLAKHQDILPEEEHNDVALTFDQELSDRISLHGDATYSRRTFLNGGAPPSGPFEVPTTNAYFVSPPGVALSPCSPAPGSPNCEQVDYSLPASDGAVSTGFSVNYQATLGISFDLGRGWSLSVDGTAGRDHDESISTDGVNNAALDASLASTSPAAAFDVFGGPNPPSLVRSIYDSAFIAPGYQGMQTAEAKLTGAVFHMWGGEAHAALGGQWEHDDLTDGIITGPPNALFSSTQELHRHSIGVYGEIMFPFIGRKNAVPGATRLDLDVAGRYEDYSDFGSTTNPMIALDWSPVRSVTFKATYGTSFRAPLLTELTGPVHGVFVQTYADPLSPSDTSVGYTLAGGNPDLKPETATTYTLGVKYDPTPRARLNADFFDIDYRNQISSYLSDLTILEQANELGALITRCPSAQCTALVDQYVTGPTKLPLFGPVLANPSVFVNGSTLNLGRTKASGFDLQGEYNLPTARAGIWSVGLSGSWFTRYDVQFTPTGATFDERNVIGFPPAMRLRGSLGWTAGAWNSQLFVNFVNSYHNTETIPTQDVASYTTLDLSVVYHFGLQFPDTKWADRMQVSLHVLNLFNTNPPYVDIPFYSTHLLRTSA